MKLRTRFSLFATILVIFVVGLASISTIYFLKQLLFKETRQNQITTLNNFRKICEESLITHDDLLLYNYIVTLKKTGKGVAYVAFADSQRSLIVGKNDIFNQIFPTFRQAEEFTESELENPNYYWTSEGDKVFDLISPVYLEGTLVGTAHLGIFHKAVEAAVNKGIKKIQRIVFFISIVSLVIGVVAAVWIAGQLTKPIYQLADGAKSIGEGNLDTQIKIDRKDELGFLAKEFNVMAVRLKELDQLKDDFVSSVSHELRSPLSAIAGYVELLTNKPIEQMQPEKRNKAFRIIQESTSRLTQFINDILDLAKIKAGRIDIRKSPANIYNTINGIFGLFNPLFEKKKINDSLKVPENLPNIPVDEEKIKQVITNLTSNAIKFTPEGGSITISAKESEGWEFLKISLARFLKDLNRFRERGKKWGGRKEPD